MIEQDEFEQYRRKPLINTNNSTEDDFEQYRRQEQPKKRFGEGASSWKLGLGQALEDFVLGAAEDVRGAEPEFPDSWKPERLRKENRPESSESIFNLEELVNPGDELGFNVGRYGPLLVAALLSGGKTLHSLAKPYTNKALGNAIVKGGKEAKKTAKREYNNFFDQVEGKNPTPIDISVPKEDLEKVLSAATDKKYYKSLQKAIDNPTPRNVHFAQSDLGKFIRKWKDKTDLPGPIHEALKTAIDAQDNLKNDLYRSLMKSGGLDAPFEYTELGNKFAKNVVPYLENSSIRKASLKPGQKGYINPKRLPHKLSLESSDPFKAHIRGDPITKEIINPLLHGKYEELELNRLLTNPYLLGTVGVGGGAAGLAKLLMGK